MSSIRDVPEGSACRTGESHPDVQALIVISSVMKESFFPEKIRRVNQTNEEDIIKQTK